MSSISEADRPVAFANSLAPRHRFERAFRMTSPRAVQRACTAEVNSLCAHANAKRLEFASICVQDQHLLSTNQSHRTSHRCCEVRQFVFAERVQAVPDDRLQDVHVLGGGRDVVLQQFVRELINVRD